MRATGEDMPLPPDEPAARTTPASMTAVNAEAADPTVVESILDAAVDIDSILDAQLIDPWSEPEACSVDSPVGCVPFMERFKKLVREDYYAAEALWAGLFCSVGVSVGMLLTRTLIMNLQPPETSPITGYILSRAAEAASEYASTLDLSLQQLSSSGLY